MSRGVVLSAILGDSRLQAKGFNEDNVCVAYDKEQRPSDQMFMVLRYGSQSVDQAIQRGPRDLVIWIHLYREFSTDYAHIDDVIVVLDDVLLNIIDTAGDDGFAVTQIDAGDKSGDFKDDTYQTLCRSTSFKVLSRAIV